VRRDAVLRRIDFRDLIAIGEVRHADDDGLLPIRLDRRPSRKSERARLLTLRVDIARHHRRRNGIVRIEQLERDHRSRIDRKPVIRHRRRLHALLLHNPAIQLPELRIDPEFVRDLPELVPVLIHQRPLRFRIDLKEMAYDGEPLRRINEQELRAGFFDFSADGLIRAS
jgi:hypothetical protein